MQERRAEVGGIEVFWREAPTTDGGPPVVYVHGVPTNSDDWVPFLEKTGGLALDLRGVEVCDAAGVAALARACEHARRAGHAIGLAASTAHLDRLMVLTDSLHLVADHLDAGPDPAERPT